MQTISLFRLLPIEFLKTRRSKILPLLFVPPLLVVTSGVASISEHLSANPGHAWESMFVQSALLYGYYLLPFSLVVVCVMLAGQESANNGIIKMLTLPVERHKLALSKFIVLSCYLLLALMMFFFLFMLAGLIAAQSNGINEPLPIVYILKWSIVLFLGALPALAVMWMITVLFDKQAISITLNMLLILPGVFVVNTDFWPLYPYCYNGVLITDELSRMSGSTAAMVGYFPFIPLAVLFFAAATLISSMKFGKKAIL